MPGYLAAFTLLLLVGSVLLRVALMKRAGVKAMHFGGIDRKDFLIPPFALFYFYTVFAAAFGLPLLSTRRWFQSEATAWVGVLLCCAGLAILLASLVSFGRSFRVGIDVSKPDQLVTTGLFVWSRNPIYLAFGLVLLGQLLVFPNPVPLAYLAGGYWLLHRQVLREEEFMRGHYGQDYAAYCRRVRRYL
jgi:protein-S-isoprenylcysteine O-methyltransferase Ste14